ncbi:MAG: DUF4404 family protein [Gammaproteobacteria bacterium]|nr:DUF4404 family protein [Gammaproteobacteria bacterium]
MSRETLRQHLDQLHAELSSTQTLDADTRSMLEEVARDIEQVLEGGSDDTVRGRIEGAAVRFEAEHPSFARLLSEVTDTLAKIGL